MSGTATKILGAALSLLAAAALIVAAVLLAAGSDDAAPVRIFAPQPTAVVEPPVREIWVQVSGAVESPGVYRMNEGDRVMDAIAAAGGFSPGANTSTFNMARRVQDEARYHVPTLGEVSATAPPPSATVSTRRESGPGESLIDLNSASSQELQALPGIGPVKAENIVSHRDSNGPFGSVEDLENVAGIGPKILESIRSVVTVTGQP